MTKMLRIWSEKLKAKFPATTRGYSMAKNAYLDDAFLEVFKRESLQQKDKNRRKRKGQKKFEKNKKPKDVSHFLVQMS